LEKAKTEWEADTKSKRYTVTEDNVAEVVSMMTGIPVQRVGQADSAKLLNMKEKINEKIIGQDEAIKKLTRAIQRTRAGLKDPKKPIGSFIFLGPTGVGKTELAKELARFMFDSDDSN
jgi:ATP-dependent Clp protease ATP-binding subunit ClpC